MSSPPHQAIPEIPSCLLTQGVSLSPFFLLCPFSGAQAVCRATGVGVESLDQSLVRDSWELWGGEPVPTHQARDAQAHATHLVSSPLSLGWVLTPLCPVVGCSVPANTIHVEALVTDAVQASTSSRGSLLPPIAPMNASVSILCMCALPAPMAHGYVWEFQGHRGHPNYWP